MRFLAFSAAFIFAVTLHCYSRAVNVSRSVYEQTETVDIFLYATPLPSLTAFTICMWLNVKLISGKDHIISLSVSGEDNEMIIMTDGDDVSLMLKDSIVSRIDSYNDDELERFFIGWHRHCWVWSAGGLFQWYSSLSYEADLSLRGSVSSGSHTAIDRDGNLVIFQEQDGILSGFNVDQLVQGKVAWFNMWDSALSLVQLNALSCESTGNVVTQSDLLIGGVFGLGAFSEESLYCKSEEAPLERINSEKPAYSTLAACRVSGARLSGHTLQALSIRSIHKCLALCSRQMICVSVNYNTETGLCELNSGEASDYTVVEDYDNQLPDNFKYFSFRAC